MSSFDDCIRQHMAEKRLDPKKAEALLEKYNNLKSKYEKFQGAGAADKAAQDIVQAETDAALQKARNLRQHGIKVRELEIKFAKSKGSIANKVENEYQLASWQGQSVKGTVHSFMDKIADDIGGDFFGFSRNHELIKSSLRSLLGETVDDPNASKIAEVFRKSFDYLHSRYKASGGVIGFQKNYFPQVHRAEAIRTVSKQEWVDYTMPKLDLEKMIDETTGLPFDEVKLRGVLDGVYDDITTGGRSSSGGKRVSFDARKSSSRFLNFKKADDFLEYNSRFGMGDSGLLESFLGYIDSYSRDIGILETLGPKPDKMASLFDSKMVDGKTSKIKRDWMAGQYKVLRGFGGGEVEGTFSRLFSGVQNWIRASSLGSASISAMSDTAFVSATAKVHGLSSTRVLGKYLKIMTGNKDLNQIARRSGFLAHVINGNVLADTRFAGEVMTGKFTRALATATNKLSGLHAMTRATQDAIALEFNGTLAELVSSKTAWAGLSPDFKNALNRVGFNEDDWGHVLKAKTLESPYGGKFLMTNDMRADPDLDIKVSKKVADKLDTLTYALRQEAANEAGLATRAITTGAIFGDGSPGSLSRNIASTVFMFKSFPISVTLTHFIPALRRAGLISGGEGGRKFDHLAMIAIGTTMIGAVSITLKDLTRGQKVEDPEKFFTPKLLLHSFMQGGGMGLFGDFLLRDASRFGRGPVTEALGPMVGLMDDVFRATKGNFDKSLSGEDPNFLRDTFRITKRNIPVVGSLWYTRLALERLILDNIERLIDPRFDSKMRERERKIFKEKGEKYWWR